MYATLAASRPADHLVIEEIAVETRRHPGAAGARTDVESGGRSAVEIAAVKGDGAIDDLQAIQFQAMFRRSSIRFKRTDREPRKEKAEWAAANVFSIFITNLS